MGLNKLFRRFTLGGSSCKFDKSKRNDCSLVDKDSDNTSLNKKKFSFSIPKNNKASVSSTYPSCPALNVPSNNKKNIQNNDVNATCCVPSSSSSSLFIHQQSKYSKSFLRLKRSATMIRQIPNVRKRSKNFSRGCSVAPDTKVSKLPQLPQDLFIKCIDQINNPFELCRLKSINSTIFQYVQERFDKVVEIDVRKIKLTTISPELSDLPKPPYLTTEILSVDNKIWHIHRHGCKVLARFADNGRRIEIVVNDQWTSKDVILLHHIMEIFRKSLQSITLDAPIVELVNFCLYFLKNIKIF